MATADQLELPRTFSRGERVQVIEDDGRGGFVVALQEADDELDLAESSFLAALARALEVPADAVAGGATKGYPFSAVRRPPAELAPPLTPAGKPSRVRNAVVARLATAGTPPEAMMSAAHDAAAFGRIVTRGRAKVQTMTDLGTRERVKRAAHAGNLSEGEVVRRALAIGLHAMGW